MHFYLSILIATNCGFLRQTRKCKSWRRWRRAFHFIVIEILWKFADSSACVPRDRTGRVGFTYNMQFSAIYFCCMGDIRFSEIASETDFAMHGEYYVLFLLCLSYFFVLHLPFLARNFRVDSFWLPGKRNCRREFDSSLKNFIPFN